MWKQLVAKAPSGSFDYDSPDNSFRGVVHGHFRKTELGARFGVYVVHRVVDNEVVYIGKGGTITPDGTSKSQDIRGRLKAIRGVVNSDRWFGDACRERGALRVDYVFLSASPVSPALAEAKLLQALLNENGRLPRYNHRF